MDRRRDWTRVNWESFEETIQEIRDELLNSENAVNAMAEKGDVPPEVWSTLGTINSALVGLSSVVSLLYSHVKEREAEA